MQQQRISGPRQGLIPRLIAGITGVVVLVGAFLVGLVAWIVLAGFLLIGGVALSIWVWRQRRRFEKFQQQSTDSIIEAEYEVIHETQSTRETKNRP